MSEKIGNNGVRPDGASLYARTLSRKQRIPGFSPDGGLPSTGTPFTEAEQGAAFALCTPSVIQSPE